ncbi:MAG TPA: oligosaccharide flippase family protein [Acidobacteriota bacterium]
MKTNAARGAFATPPMPETAALAPAGARLLAAQLSAAASGFLLSLLIGRSLGPAALGTYAAALALLIVQLTFTELGFSILLTREAARRPRRIHRLLLGSSALKLALFALSIPAVLLLRGPTPIELLIPGMLWVLLSALALGPLALLRGRELFATHLRIQLAEAGLLIPAALWLALHAAPLPSYFWLLAAAQAFKLTCAAAAQRARLGAIRGGWSFRGPFLPWILRAGARFGLVVLVSVVYFRADILLLRALAGATETGRYAAALALLETGKLLPSALLGVLYPKFSSAGAELAALARSGLRRATLLALAPAATLFGLAPWLPAWIFGPSFDSEAGLLRLLALVLIPAALSSGLTLLLLARGHETAVARCAAVAIAVLVAGLLILVPRLAATGAAAARGAAETVFCLLLLGQCRALLRS